MTAYEIIAWLGRHAERTAHLCLDSRQVQQGDVFFACPGTLSDGRQYIDDALENGAVAVLVEAALRRHVRLDADDRLHSDTVRRFPEVERAKCVSVVCYRDRGHALRGDRFHERLYPRCPIEHRVLTVRVKMYETVVCRH